MNRVLLVWLAAAVLCAAQGGKKNPLAGDEQAVKDGRHTFRMHCSFCHGIKAEGGRGPDLTLGTYNVGDTDEALFGAISNGVPGTEMPDFGERLGDEDVWRLVSYIRSVARRDTAGVTGNAESGKALFWNKGQCGQCHLVDGKGGRMGPDLTRIGRRRSLAYLRESVLNPNADLTPGYPTITVFMRDGKQIVGVQRGFDNFSVQLMDVGEKFYSFMRSDVRSVRREFKSLMPDNYRALFTETELNDLLAYMVSLRGKEGESK